MIEGVFRKPTSPPLPLREGPPLISVFSPQGRRGNRPTRCSNRFAIRLADHQRSTPAAELRFAVCDRMDMRERRSCRKAMKPNTPSCMIEITQHVLKGQKLLAQGNALGMRSVSNAPCKGKSFKIHIIKMVNQLRYVKLLPLQGDRFANIKNPGRCPGLRASALSGRAG